MTKLILALGLVLFSYTSFAQTDFTQPENTKLSGSIALHIAKAHYQHPVHLLHPYLNIWSMQGPIAEQAAMPSLQSHFSQVSECASDSEANVVLLLEPHVFYNPQLHVFHTEYIARAYTSNGAPITHIKKQAQQLGSLNIMSDFFIEKGYTKAMNKVIAKLMVDQNFLAALNQKETIKAGEICQQLDNLPLDKFYY